MAVLDAGCSWRESHSWTIAADNLDKHWDVGNGEAWFLQESWAILSHFGPYVASHQWKEMLDISWWIKALSQVTSFCFVVFTTEVCPCKKYLFLKCRIQGEHFVFHGSRSSLLPLRFAAWTIIKKIKSNSILPLNLFCDAPYPRKPISSPSTSF